MTDAVLDLFAGPGGWDQGVRELGIEPRGIELDADACGTGRAAGHYRHRANVALAEPLMAAQAWGAPAGLIASPPCQGFSTAGHGRGRADSVHMLAELDGVRDRGDLEDALARLHGSMTDDRSLLALEPLRWALALRPGWLAWEQVPAVLPLWDACAVVLRTAGWSTATAVLNAEQYGVPQTRRRAILVASLDGEARLPEPTHSRYYPRTPGRLDEGVKPWVSMAEALGWSLDDRVGFPRRADGHEAVEVDGIAYRARDLHPASRPAPALTEKVRSWSRVIMNGAGATGLAPRELDQPAATVTGKGTAAWVIATGTRPESTVRSGDQPAPALAFGKDAASHVWAPAGTRPEDVPALKRGEAPPDWAFTRPATTVQGDPRIWPPGHKVNADDQRRLGVDEANDRYGDRAGRHARRVTVDEAAILQTFPAGYPWQGSKTAQYRQVGDAVPPLLAQAVVAAITGAGR